MKKKIVMITGSVVLLAVGAVALQHGFRTQTGDTGNEVVTGHWWFWRVVKVEIDENRDGEADMLVLFPWRNSRPDIHHDDPPVPGQEVWIRKRNSEK